MISEDGLVDIARYCKDLRSLRLDGNDIDRDANGKWLHELALCNTVMESLYFQDPFDTYDMKDVTLLVKKCSKSLMDVGLGYIGEYGDNLRNLSLSYTGGSDVGLLELSKGCQKLRKLTLKGYPYSEKEISAVVFNMNHSLRYIRDKGDAGYHGVLIRPMVSDEASLYLFTMEPPLGHVT
nr:ACT domain-containing protein [Tanacetum cinerariifolium]